MHWITKCEWNHTRQQVTWWSENRKVVYRSQHSWPTMIVTFSPSIYIMSRDLPTRSCQKQGEIRDNKRTPPSHQSTFEKVKRKVQYILRGVSVTSLFAGHIRELKHPRFSGADGNRNVGCCWLKFDHGQIWANNTQHIATRVHGGQTHATCCAQQCCDMLHWHVAIVWPGLNGEAILGSENHRKKNRFPFLDI